MSEIMREIEKIEVGTILADWFDEGVRCLVMRGPASLCAYLGVPKDHPLAGFDYDSIPLDCHYGLTYSGDGQRSKSFPPGYWYYGWDYAHSGDISVYDLKFGNRSLSDKAWGVKEVKCEIEQVLWDFKKLVKLAERIKKSPSSEGKS